MSSKGQITIPKVVREALGIKEGDALMFRVDGKCAVMTRVPDLLDLAGSVTVPAGKEDATWDEIVGETWAKRAAERH